MAFSCRAKRPFPKANYGINQVLTSNEDPKHKASDLQEIPTSLILSNEMVMAVFYFPNFGLPFLAYRFFVATR